MRAEIMRHKFIEFGKHQQHLYGIKSDSVLDVIQSGKMCIMDVHPQVCNTNCIQYISTTCTVEPLNKGYFGGSVVERLSLSRR